MGDQTDQDSKEYDRYPKIIDQWVDQQQSIYKWLNNYGFPHKRFPLILRGSGPELWTGGQVIAVDKVFTFNRTNNQDVTIYCRLWIYLAI